jgi:predicted AAA+ superfamily ATPase
LRQHGDSLAGRVAYVVLPPVAAAEVEADLATQQAVWLRGGYPLSYLADGDGAAYEWRQDFMATFLRRDLPDPGLRVPAETLRRFWTMLAYLHGQLFYASQLGRSLGGASHATAGRYLDTMVDTLMVWRLESFPANVSGRLVKSPKVQVATAACCMRCWAWRR